MRFVVAHPTDHELRHRVERELGGLADENVGDAGEEVSSSNSREVVIEREQRRPVRSLPPRTRRVNEAVHALDVLHHSVLPRFDAHGSEGLFEGCLHVLVVPRIQHHLNGALADVLFESDQQVRHKMLLCAGATDRNEKAQRLARFQAFLANFAILVDVFDEVTWDPVARKAQVLGGNAHLQEVRVVGGALDKVDGARRNDEPLRVVVDHEVDHVLESRGDGGMPYQRVCGDDRSVLRKSEEEGAYVLSHLVGGA
mmetsp:Transcript_58162/g.118987  ORF Transcript_58162/g.118987 Transcript_58162/m.118987 type:complete len:255 (-) Transcript_58162:755-1519(-)